MTAEMLTVAIVVGLLSGFSGAALAIGFLAPKAEDSERVAVPREAPVASPLPPLEPHYPTPERFHDYMEKKRGTEHPLLTREP